MMATARPATGFRPLRPLVRAFNLWMDADGLRMSAAMSFYGILSLAPLLVLLVGLFGWWLDRTVLERELVTQIGTIVGEQGAAVVRAALESAKRPADGLLASLIGFIILLFGATGVFGELQSALERLWFLDRGVGVDVAPPSWRHTASRRLRGVAYVLAFGFLLLVSLAISTLLRLFAGWAGNWLALEQVLLVFSEVLAYGVCAALFLGLMRMSTGPKPRWRFLALGACVGATLFTVGRHVLAAYLATAAVVSAYGAAGALVVLLMWIYFSAAVLLFAAGCARAVEEEAQRESAPASPAAASKELSHA